MFGRISFIGEDNVLVDLNEGVELKKNILSSHVVITDKEKMLLGEISELNQGKVKIKLLGEFQNGKLFGGIIRKPLLDSVTRPVNEEEINIILGGNNEHGLSLGVSPFYNDASVFFNINEFFSNHFAIFGNSGSGKSCGMARLVQNVFLNDKVKPYNANFILFDVSGEYSHAFSNLSSIDPNYNYRVFTTSDTNKEFEQLHIPIWLLDANVTCLQGSFDCQSNYFCFI